jgi:predicted nucleic acid-binding protein
MDLYAQRKDKELSLVDCLSFVTMQTQTITDAWRSDHHLQQAGFNALLI